MGFKIFATDNLNTPEVFTYTVNRSVSGQTTTNSQSCGTCHTNPCSCSSGSKWLTGENTPTINLGNHSDLYLDSLTGDVYQKVNNAWVYIMNISGPVGVDSHYEHVQGAPLAIWNVAHNLNKFPSVSVVDSAGTVIIGSIEYIDSNNTTLTFSAAFSGKAYFN